jgi:hypothetical protein
MPFTQEDNQKIQSWMTSHVGQIMRCFMCGAGQWALHTDAVLLVNFDTTTGRVHYMDGVPLVPFVCTSCGHAVFFSTMMMGLIPEPPPEVAEAMRVAEEAAAVQSSDAKPAAKGKGAASKK